MKIGDRVFVNTPFIRGEGVIRVINTITGSYGVELDDIYIGHNLDSALPINSDSGWWCSEDQLQLIKKELLTKYEEE